MVMPVQGEFRNRDEIDVKILDALVDRSEEGMTVFELRTHVGADINEIERALTDLNDDGLIIVENGGHGGDQTVIKPASTVLPDDSPQPSRSLADRLREWLPF